MTSCLTAAAVASGAVVAQGSDLAPIDPTGQLLEQIADLRSEGGPTPASAIDPLRDLARLYESAGEHASAIVALEEARHITRVHQGLSSADEALLLREEIRNEKALGNERRVWDLEGDMVAIARKHYDDVRMMPVFRELAEDRAAAFEEYRAGGFPPEIELGCYYAAGPRGVADFAGGDSCSSGSSDAVRQQFRLNILRYYTDAIEVLVQAGHYASPELRDLEKQAFRFSSTLNVFLNPFCPGTLEELVTAGLGTCLEPVSSGVGNWAGLVRLIAYEIHAGAPAAARANAFADLADWHLLVTSPDRRRFDDMSDAAFRIYEGAYRLLQENDDASAITEIFSPELPVTLPTFQPNPFASAAAAEPSRYVDVAFEVTKYGRSERIEILATTKDASRAEKRDLIQLIETTTFRPRFVDGKLADSAPVVLRYALGP
ncbi:MAG TPA: hypothetical protein VGL98_12835 [Gammaproteobacteria bacterium]